MKIFVSYSRTDGGHFAEKIYKDLSKEGYEVFTDENCIRAGEKWNESIEKNISKCDVFVIIVTPRALKSQNVESEVMQAQKENKRIIPCFYVYIKEYEIKWTLKDYQGIEFDNKYDMALKLYSKLENIKFQDINKENLYDKSTSVSITKDNQIPIKKDSQSIRKMDDEDNKDNRNELTDFAIFQNGKDLKDKITEHSISQIRNETNLEKHKDKEEHLTSTTSNKRDLVGISNISQLQEYIYKTSWKIKDMPDYITTGSNGFIYITALTIKRKLLLGEYKHLCCVYKFDSDGNFIKKWGSYGSENGQFADPKGIAVDSRGCVYLADFKNYRVQKFDSDGNFIKKWGSYGSENGQFVGPHGIAVEPSYNIMDSITETVIPEYVVSQHIVSLLTDQPMSYEEIIDRDIFWAGKKWKLSPNLIFSHISKLLEREMTEKTRNGEYTITRKGISINSYMKSRDYILSVYVTDFYNHNIQKFDSDGNFIKKWGSYGSENGNFIKPTSIAIDPLVGFVYVTDSGNNNIQKFDSNGNFITSWGCKGIHDFQLDGPTDIAVDTKGYVYVTDVGIGWGTVLKFNSDGNFITKWEFSSKINDPIFHPTSVIVNTNGDVYVTDTYNRSIRIFSQ